MSILRKRDNIEDFVFGLVSTEIFPYPEGKHSALPATTVAFQRVMLRESESRVLTGLRVVLPQCEEDKQAQKKRSFVEIKLLPQEGEGCYTEDVNELFTSNPTDPGVTADQQKQLRYALWARYDWVMNKIATVNELRRLHHEGEHDFDGDDDIEDGFDDNLSEEPEPDFSDNEEVRQPYGAGCAVR